MKRLHIVNPYGSAAMQRMTQPLISELPRLYEVSTSETVDISADINLHMPWHTLAGLEDKGERKHVIAYTHVNPGAQAALMDACERADLIVCMSFAGRRELAELGADPKKLWVNYSAADFKYRKRVIGVIGYPQPNGRKREHLILDLAWQYDLSPFQFIFVGGGWEGFVAQLQSLGVTADCVHAENEQVIADVYNRLDLLLVTGYVEGGPLPILEAMAAGVPVLSPDFGYASDLLEPESIYDDLQQLMEKLTSLAQGTIDNHKLARAWTWRDYAAEYALILGRLTGESVDLYPERGMSRYAQLLDIIDEERPSDIVEIGTWSGSNAIRMIQQAAKHRPMGDIYYQGFDLFESMTGEQFRRELSKHGWNEHIVQKRLDATGASVDLFKGDTKETLINLYAADFFFIDGGHSEETIQSDTLNVLPFLRENNLAIFDDYYHAGKPDGVGCNKVIDNLDPNEFEITHLPVRTLADDGREIGMVKVRRRANIRLQVPETTHATSDADILAGISRAVYPMYTSTLSAGNVASTSKFLS